MNAAQDGQDFRNRMGRLETLLQGAEQYPDPSSRTHTRVIVQSLMELHGAALERILERVAEADKGLALIDSLAEDDLIGSLLVLYGLHPLDLETRVRQALEKVRPYLRSHGGNVELLALTGGLVRLRMEGSCHGCASSAQTLKTTIEEAIYEKAADVTGIEVEGDGGAEAVSFAGTLSGRARLSLPVVVG